MRRASRSSPRACLAVTNRSGYSTEDLRAFFARGLSAMGVRQCRRVIVVAAPARSRGCADVGVDVHQQGKLIVIAIAPPSRFSLRRLARLFEHEVSHTLGLEHEAMSHDLLWSLGAVPKWARDSRIRYLGRAPNQL
jgi:hypothetical protein